MTELRVEPSGENPTIKCECCGNETRTVWGYVYDLNKPIAAYFVQWTRDAPRHYPNFDFLIGTWGDDAAENDRVLVSFSYSPAPDGGAFMAIDSRQRPAASSPLCRKALSRHEVVGNSQLMDLSTRIIDAIWLGDARIDELKKLDTDA